MNKLISASLLPVIVLSLAACSKTEECKIAERQVGRYKLEVMRYKKKVEDQKKIEILEDDDNFGRQMDAEYNLDQAKELRDIACR